MTIILASCVEKWEFAKEGDIEMNHVFGCLYLLVIVSRVAISWCLVVVN